MEISFQPSLINFFFLYRFAFHSALFTDFSHSPYPLPPQPPPSPTPPSFGGSLKPVIRFQSQLQFGLPAPAQTTRVMDGDGKAALRKDPMRGISGQTGFRSRFGSSGRAFFFPRRRRCAGGVEVYGKTSKAPGFSFQMIMMKLLAAALLTRHSKHFQLKRCDLSTWNE